MSEKGHHPTSTCAKGVVNFRKKYDWFSKERMGHLFLLPYYMTFEKMPPKPTRLSKCKSAYWGTGTLNHWKNLSKSQSCLFPQSKYPFYGIAFNAFLSCYLSQKVFKFANLHQRGAPKSSSNMSSWKSFLTTYWLDHKSGVATSSVANFWVLAVQWDCILARDDSL